MKKIFLSAVMALSMTNAFANEGDLTLPGERWLAKFTAFVCGDGNTQTASVPSEFAAQNIVFGKAVTDITLDNYLIKATFEENGVACSYSSILLADNAAWTIKLIESKAYAPNGGSECVNGKAVIDAALNDNAYKYLHGRAAIYVPSKDAAALCGEGNTTVGLHFQVSGKI
jgi:hypothetical protein